VKEREENQLGIVTPSETEPYIEYGSFRLFLPGNQEQELEWHVDFEDRLITIVEPGGWKIQFDNQVPRLLIQGEEIFINKLTWHRIISGDSNLLIKIKKMV
jgi:hypothetical protein